MIAEERIRPIVIDELPPGRTGRAIVHEDDARFARPQQIERKLQRAKFLWTVDQNGIARLNESRQDFARVAKQTFDIAMRRKFGKRDGIVGGAGIKFDADNFGFGKTMRQGLRAPATRAS